MNKAEIILNSYLLPKSAILYEIFLKKLDFKNFFFNFWRKKIFDRKFFEKFFEPELALLVGLQGESIWKGVFLFPETVRG